MACTCRPEWVAERDHIMTKLQRHLATTPHKPFAAGYNLCKSCGNCPMVPDWGGFDTVPPEIDYRVIRFQNTIFFIATRFGAHMGPDPEPEPIWPLVLYSVIITMFFMWYRVY